MTLGCSPCWGFFSLCLLLAILFSFSRNCRGWIGGVPVILIKSAPKWLNLSPTDYCQRRTHMSPTWAQTEGVPCFDVPSAESEPRRSCVRVVLIYEFIMNSFSHILRHEGFHFIDLLLWWLLHFHDPWAAQNGQVQEKKVLSARIFLH